MDKRRATNGDDPFQDELEHLQAQIEDLNKVDLCLDIPEAPEQHCGLYVRVLAVQTTSGRQHHHMCAAAAGDPFGLMCISLPNVLLHETAS